MDKKVMMLIGGAAAVIVVAVGLNYLMEKGESGDGGEAGGDGPSLEDEVE